MESVGGVKRMKVWKGRKDRDKARVFELNADDFWLCKRRKRRTW
jgi:hypothetical protein